MLAKTSPGQMAGAHPFRARSCRMELKIRGVSVEGINSVVVTAYAVPALGRSKRGEGAWIL
jgi:hypothetical protein